jgi:urease accessory protein
MIKRSLLLATLLFITLPATAFAHVGFGGTQGFAQGFSHPLGGLDHILAMVGVGLLAARLGGRALWLVPAAFLALMTLGGAIGMTGVILPVETAIAASLVAIGLAIVLGAPTGATAAALLVGFFAIFHGHAHGSEMPAMASSLVYGLGFIAATALFHAAGIGLGFALQRIETRSGFGLAQASGAAMAITGLGLLAGAF